MPTRAYVPTSTTGVVHGEVLTRSWVAEMILDLAGYTSDRDLTRFRIVEPAAGTGAFVAAIMNRLVTSARTHNKPMTLKVVGEALRVFDIQTENIEALRKLVIGALTDAGVGAKTATELSEVWVRHDDYLLPASENRCSEVDVVVGNPPYIRLEDIPANKATKYRNAYPTMTGRADIYIAFFEAGLRSLKPGGRLAFICADRWMRNDYGRGLRQLVTTDGFAMDAIITAHEADMFETDVDAYPAITIIRRGKQGKVALADTTAAFTAKQAPALVKATTKRQHKETKAYTVGAVEGWHPPGKLGWPHGSPATIERLAALDSYPTIEDTGARIGIGIATGADAVYVTHPNRLPPDVEDDRLLKLSHADDIRSGQWKWTGRQLVNPWTVNGLVSPDKYPKLAEYLLGHPVVKQRNVAKKNPNSWWRTIDRVAYPLLDRPLILLQDMSQQVTPVISPIGFYPHHNLYWIDVQGSGWKPDVLAGLLLAEQIRAQIVARCVLMRGRTLRLQAQYLRQIRVPAPNDVSAEDAKEFRVAYLNCDRERATRVLATLLPQ